MLAKSFEKCCGNCQHDMCGITNERRKELEAQWKTLEKRADQFIQSDIPGFNRKLWEQKIGALWEGTEK